MSLYNLVKILRYECFGFFNLRSKLTLYNFQENCPIFELKWNVEGSLARSELKPLVKVVQNDLYGLFTRLREYAILSRNRTELIQEFDDNFKRQFKIQRGVKYIYIYIHFLTTFFYIFLNCNIYLKENGVTLTWLQNLFQITWSMRYCEYTEEIINFFDIEINQNGMSFTFMHCCIFSIWLFFWSVF